MARERKVAANATIKRSKRVRDVVTRITLQQTSFTLTRRAESAEGLVTWQVRVDLLDLLDHRSLNRRVAARRAKAKDAKSKCDKMLDLWRDCTPLIPVLQEECPRSARVSPGSQETTMIGAIGSYFDLGSVREGINELRGAGEEICSVSFVGAPSAREGEFVDIEIGSDADMSCLLRTLDQTRARCMGRCSACVEVITLQLVAENRMDSVQESWVWKLAVCEATWRTCWCDSES